VRFDLSQSIRSQHASSVLKFASAPSRDFRIASTIERDQMRFWLLPLATGTDVPAIGVRALSHNEQLQQPPVGIAATPRVLHSIVRPRRASNSSARPLNCGVRPQPGVHAMIDHTGIGVAEIAVSAAFYDAALGALGLRRVMQLPEGDGSDAIGYGVEYPVFWIDRFHPHGVRQHTAFVAKSRRAVDSFHEAALKSGGVDNGGPGTRAPLRGNAPGYYGAFVLDPDGNNIEAVYRDGW
jgi:catechol 2,3-dioxygenase-like lactoylglutathione lyase family enzyme